MSEEAHCPRCGAPSRAGDELCRRCGTEAPRPVEGPLGVPSGGGPPRLSLPWLFGGVAIYLGFLFFGAQLLAEPFAESAPMLQSILTSPTEEALRANSEALTDLFLKFLAVVGASYFLGGLVQGRIAIGRPRLQAALAAGLSWAVLSLRAPALLASGSVLLHFVLGGLLVTAFAAVGASFGHWLRPRP